MSIPKPMFMPRVTLLTLPLLSLVFFSACSKEHSAQQERPSGELAPITQVSEQADLIPAVKAGETLMSTDEAFEKVMSDASLVEARQRLLDRAKKDVDRGVIHRPETLDELYNSQLSIRYKKRPAHMSELNDEMWRTFALALGDTGAGTRLAVRLPRMAAAVRIQKDPEVYAYVVDQLQELASWAPLQRPGWSLRNSNLQLKPGGDGAWLGTGTLVRAITESLAILPEGSLPDGLREALHQRLASELAAVYDDFVSKRPWYAKGQAVQSNQWILPSEALVRASITLGVDANREAYELGVQNLIRSMDFQGKQGEFVEGHSYARMSLAGILSAARAMAQEGDRRLIDHPFLANFPTWFVHHYQPGDSMLNSFDSGRHKSTSWEYKELLADFYTATANPVALWAMETRSGFPADTFNGLVAQADAASVDEFEMPPLFANYELATHLNWRSSWDDKTATGFWMRGGSSRDFHDHMDRGHVNFIVGERKILIEAGTFNYGLKNYLTHFRGVAGHNVLQVGDFTPEQLTPEVMKAGAGQIFDEEHRVAPITVEWMDATGGSASVDVSGCYASVKRWVRYVTWDAKQLTVRDEVELHAADTVLFRWHLGVSDDVRRLAVQSSPDALQSLSLQANGFSIEAEADSAITGQIEIMPDATLDLDAEGPTNHQCLVVQSAEPVSSFILNTVIKVTE
ncbi:heparinase II/III family protein [Coraliomargarita algicola]|uniref:Heparinase II/III family protein n=1 Tax=Coraliomargarita algicola TaxID=3092156 RepID=A0ABZ0RJU3_9BACT|nr:heparinase II/III family protein [Coraliomargarita sp. J2-16]WPJ95363.1 heparinase II/III family protein [Coraliomargarita sp. J2-16]